MSRLIAARPRLTGAVTAAVLLAVPIFVWTIVVPQLSGPGLHAHDGHILTIMTHFIGGSLMLLSGAIALRIGLTRQWTRWHKPAGSVYILSGAAGAASGMVASFGTPHAIGLSTFNLGLVWFGAVIMALRAARNRRFAQHRAWMIRGYVVAWASIIFRIWTHLLPASLQFPPTDMLWTSWVMPLFMAELMLQWRPGARA